MHDTITQFQASLSGLQLDNEGLAPRHNPLPKLNQIAGLARAVIEKTGLPETPEEGLAHRLAVLTEHLLTTTLAHGSPALVRAWLLARAELLELQESSRPREGLE